MGDSALSGFCAPLLIFTGIQNDENEKITKFQIFLARSFVGRTREPGQKVAS